MQNYLFCFGMSYVAKNLIKELESFKISGTSRRIYNLDNMHQFSEEISLDPATFKDATHILISIPPNAEGDIVFQKHIEDLRSLKHLKWFGLCSTTGVYGDTKGEWVYETSELKAIEEKSKLRILAEQQYLNSGLPVHIFRLSGIYGPERNHLDSIKNGTAKRIYKEGHFFSRIHVEDIAQIIKTTMLNPKPSIYNLADDMPAPQHEVIEYAASLLDMPPPTLINWDSDEVSESMQSYFRQTRRVSNKKIKEALGIKLKYPTYKEGLKACLK